MRKGWRTSILLLLLSVLCSCAARDLINPGDWYGPQVMSLQQPLTGDLPRSFSWSNKDGRNFLSRVKTQRAPLYCRSGWAQAVTSVISDRINIMRGGIFPEISLSAQVLLSCDTTNRGCQGGSHTAALDWIKDNYLTDESCAPYLAMDFSDGNTCTEMAVCKECNKQGKCWVPEKYNKYNILNHGNIPARDTEALMREVYTNGPVICALNDGPIISYFGDKVFASSDPGAATQTVSIVGWGESKSGTPYWIVRNSFGEEWGNRGFINIYRGNNTLRIEETCTWVTVKNTWENQIYPHKDFDQVASPEKQKNSHLQRKLETFFHLTRDEHDHHLPENFFFGSVDGVNYLSLVINQHLPQYCGSCWAQSTASALSDRINFLITKNQPRIKLSAQYLINCNGVGGCHGGFHDRVYEYIQKHGIAEEGCQPYTAYQPKEQQCTALQQCMLCSWVGSSVTSCTDQPYRRWRVKEFGQLNSTEEIKREIFARGPVTCKMRVTDGFRTYKGGVYSEEITETETNHTVSLVGFGKEKATGREYWIVRNSWGTQWGEDGYFRIQTGKDNLLMETRCFYGVPVLE